MRPSQRNKITAEINKAKGDLETWRKAASRLTYGTLPHTRAHNEMIKAQDRINSLTVDLMEGKAK